MYLYQQATGAGEGGRVATRRPARAAADTPAPPASEPRPAPWERVNARRAVTNLARICDAVIMASAPGIETRMSVMRRPPARASPLPMRCVAAAARGCCTACASAVLPCPCVALPETPGPEGPPCARRPLAPPRLPPLRPRRRRRRPRASAAPCACRASPPPRARPTTGGGCGMRCRDQRSPSARPGSGCARLRPHGCVGRLALTPTYGQPRA